MPLNSPIPPKSLSFILHKLIRRSKTLLLLFITSFQRRIRMRVRGAAEGSIAAIIKYAVRDFEVPNELSKPSLAKLSLRYA